MGEGEKPGGVDVGAGGGWARGRDGIEAAWRHGRVIAF